MTKTYFMRVYDIIIYLSLFAILTVMISKLFDLLNITVYHTIALRHYLKQDIDTDKSQDQQQTVDAKTNPVQRYFNKIVGESLVDVRQNEVRVAIKIPRKQQAHENIKKHWISDS